MKSLLQLFSTALLGVFLLVSTNAYSQEDNNDTANVQIIHNSADPALAEVDVYLNGTRILENFSFREATAYLPVPAGEEIIVQLTLPGAAAEDGFTYPFTLTPDENYVIVANGVIDPTNFADNPNDKEIAFDLYPLGDAQTEATDAGNIDIRVFHGATDAPAVDLALAGMPKFLEGAEYGDASGYVNIPDGDYVLELYVAGADDPLLEFSLPLETAGLTGGAAVALASGFLNSADNENGPEFAIIAVLPDGTVLNLDVVEEPEMVNAQIIHNAADPIGLSVDVYLNDVQVLESVAFRTATEFLPYEAGVEYTIGFAPAGGEVLATFDVTLDSGSDYTIIAQGVLNPENFVDNPDDNDIALELFILDNAQSEAGESDEIDIRVFHGATDAPAVDLALAGMSKFLEGAAYGDASGYVNIPDGDYVLELYVAGTDEPLQRYQLPLQTLELAGGAAVALASGFLNPASNEDGDDFAIIVVLANGDVIQLPLFEDARDVTFSVNMSLQALEGNFDVDANDKLFVRGSFNDQGFSLEDENELSALGSGLWQVTIPVTGEAGSEFSYKFYVEAGDGRDLPNDGWEGNVGDNPDGNRIAELAAVGQTLETVFFNNDEPNNANVQVIHNAADPAAAEVDIYVNGELTLEAFAFREATGFLALPAFTPIQIGVAPSGSESAEDVIATFDYTLDPGANYALVAQGVLNPEIFAANPDDVPIDFDIIVVPDARTESTVEDEFQFLVFHGASDAPAVDVGVLGSETRLVENAAYLEFSEYLGVPEDQYEMAVYPAGSDDPVAVFLVDTDGLAGNAGIVLASGFLDPTANEDGEAFTLIIVLPDGTVATPPNVTSTDEERFNLPDVYTLDQNYPNPFNPSTQINFALPQAEVVTLRVFDMLGRQVAELVQGELAAGIHTVTFDASQLVSGLYIYRIQAGEFNQTRKMMLVK